MMSVLSVSQSIRQILIGPTAAGFYFSEPMVLPKCCPIGQSLQKPAPNQPADCIVSNSTFQLEFQTERGLMPFKGRLKIGRPCNSTYSYIERTGYKLLPSGLYTNESEKPLSIDQYCLETVNDNTIRPIICEDVIADPSTSLTDTWPLLFILGWGISLAYLLHFFFAYLLKPKLWKGNGKNIFCYCLCLAMSNTLSIYILASERFYFYSPASHICKVIALLIQWSFMCCVCWLNVIYFYLWNKANDEKRLDVPESLWAFLFSCLYGFGFPLVVVIAIVGLGMKPVLPPSYNSPELGLMNSYHLENDREVLVNFYSLVTILLILNLIFIFPAYRNRQNLQPCIYYKCTRYLVFSLVAFFLWIAELSSWRLAPDSWVRLVTGAFGTQLITVYLIYVFLNVVGKKVKIFIERCTTHDDYLEAPQEIPLRMTGKSNDC